MKADIHLISLAAQRFRRRQRVMVLSGAGDEPATIVKPDKHLVGWYIVRFDDGHKLCVFGSGLAAA